MLCPFSGPPTRQPEAAIGLHTLAERSIWDKLPNMPRRRIWYNFSNIAYQKIAHL
jgi:hypothetical protein